jgi:hypothetical protein
MPGWSSRSLQPNPRSNFTTPSPGVHPHVEGDHDYITPVPAPSLQDPMNPFGNTLQASSTRASPARSPRRIRSTSVNLPSSSETGDKNLSRGIEFEHRSALVASSVDGNVESELKRHTTRPQANEDDFASGRCATCDQKVKWPRSCTEYRCGMCLMINDLTPKNLDNELADLPLDATERRTLDDPSSGTW